MSGTAYLTQPRTPDGRWDRTGRIGSAGVRLDLAEEADVAYVLDRIRAAGARRIATLAYVADRRDLAEEFEANTFEFVYERATAADPDHPTITAGEVSRIIDGSWARHVHHMRTDSLHTRMSRGNSHLMRAWAAYAAAARDAQTRLGRPLSEAEHDQLARIEARRAGTAMDIRRTGVAACHSYEDLTDGQAPSCPGAEEQWAAQADRRADERFEPPEAIRGRRALTEHYWQAKFPGAIAPQTIPRRAATGLRRTMDTSPGGVLAAARRWETGQDDAATDALFAPFHGRDLSDREKTEIVDLLRAHPALAEQLWRSAVMIATTRRAPTCPTTAAPASPWQPPGKRPPGGPRRRPGAVRTLSERVAAAPAPTREKGEPHAQRLPRPALDHRRRQRRRDHPRPRRHVHPDRPVALAGQRQPQNRNDPRPARRLRGHVHRIPAHYWAPSSEQSPTSYSKASTSSPHGCNP